MAASLAAKSAPGVSDADDDVVNQMLTVTFDDAKSSIEIIKKVMKQQGYPVEGEPQLLQK